MLIHTWFLIIFNDIFLLTLIIWFLPRILMRSIPKVFLFNSLNKSLVWTLLALTYLIIGLCSNLIIILILDHFHPIIGLWPTSLARRGVDLLASGIISLIFVLKWSLSLICEIFRIVDVLKNALFYQVLWRLHRGLLRWNIALFRFFFILFIFTAWFRIQRFCFFITTAYWSFIYLVWHKDPQILKCFLEFADDSDLLIIKLNLMYLHDFKQSHTSTASQFYVWFMLLQYF